MLRCITHMTILSTVIRVLYAGYQTRLSQAFVHFVTARTSLFTDQRMSSLPIRGKYKFVFKTICEYILDKSPTDSSSSSLKWWSSKQKLETCHNYSLFVCQFTIPLFALFSHVLPCHITMRQFLREVSPILVIFQLRWQTYVIPTFSVLIIDTFVRFTFTLSTSQMYVVWKWCWVLQDRSASSVSSTYGSYSVFNQPF